MLHFVGFKNDRYWNAVRVFGQPDFVHRIWDQRAQCEVMDGDVAVFANGDEHCPPSPFNFDDSNQPDDPAALERLEMQRGGRR